jgi:putative tricarboxylic transport membrane protein
MKIIKIGMPVFLILVSLTFLVGSFNLPKANLGNANGPLYFPIGLSFLLLFFSVLYFFQELRTINKENQKVKQMLSGRTSKLIGITVLLGAGYALIFEQIGFLFSTLLFLGALLFVVNGKQKWKVNVIVTVCFSFISWYAFSVLLGVSLP